MAIPNIPDWRERILAGVGVKPTTENLRFMDAWARAEGGTASNNPFNTTQSEPGATPYNSNNGYPVLNYRNAAQGIDATVNTLTNGRYGNIIGALREGDNAMKAAAALAASPWGTGALVQKILGGGGSTSPTPALAPPSAGSLVSPGQKLPQLNLEAPKSVFGQSLAAQSTGIVDPAMREKFQSTPGLAVNPLAAATNPSPFVTRMMANLGDMGRSIEAARNNINGAQTYGMDKDNMPVTKTLTTLQNGSADSKFKSIDLTQDFDGPVHPNANPVVNMARQYLGTPYLWGGADPRKGFDCSGFVQYLYSQAGISLGRTTYAQIKQGQHIDDPKHLQAGDVVFFQDGGDVHHEGLYIGGGQFIHAPHTGDVVKISSLSEPYYASQFAGGRRFIAPGDAPAAA